MRTKILLTNVWWSEGSEDIQLFTTPKELEDYFTSQEGWADYNNLDFADNITPNFVFNDPLNRPIIEALQCNYCVIEYDKQDQSAPTYRYYFCNITHKSGPQYYLSLSLDDITTNYTKLRSTLGPALINRAHYDTLYANPITGKDTFYNVKALPMLLNNDVEDLPKYLNKIIDIKFNYDGEGGTFLNELLNNDIKYWLYVFIDRTKNYKINNYSNNELYDIEGKFSNIKIGPNSREVGCICIPIFKEEGGRLTIKAPENNKAINVSIEGLKEFFLKNKDTSYAYSMKASKVPPFATYEGLDITDINTEPGGLDIQTPYFNQFLTLGRKNVAIDSGVCVVVQTGDTTKPLEGTNLSQAQGVIMGAIDPEEIVSENIDLASVFGLDYEFDRVAGNRKDVKYNPKMLSSTYNVLRIIGPTGNSFDYDLQKLVKSNIYVTMSSNISPLVTKTYVRVRTSGLYDNDPYYNEECNKTYLGLVDSIDASIMFTNNKYQEFLAQNKNWESIQALNVIGGSFTTGVAGGIAAGLGAANPLVGVGVGVATYLGSLLTKAVSLGLTTDNMSSSQSSLKNASGDIYFNDKIANLGYKLALYKAFPADIERSNNLTYYKGYLINDYYKPQDFDNTRTYFNYLICDLGPIRGNLSNIEKQRLRDIFNKGVRLWHVEPTPEVYELENVQRRIV